MTDSGREPVLPVAHLIESGTHVAHPLTQALVRLGRDAACEVLVRDATVSRRHAEVRSIGTTRVLTVTGSTGARVNDSRISAPVTLAHGDRIEIGLRSYVYHQGELPAGISSYVGHGQEAQLEAQQDPLLARTTQSNPVIDRNEAEALLELRHAKGLEWSTVAIMAAAFAIGFWFYTRH